MEGDPSLRILGSVLLVLCSCFFVAAEYALVTSRSTRIDALARKGNKSAKVLQAALKNLSWHLAGIQVCITMVGIGIGAVTEPLVTELIASVFGKSINRGISVALSIALVTTVLVIVGELVPKYASLQHPEKVALVVVRPLRLFILALGPLVWLIERAGNLVLRVLRIDPNLERKGSISKEELMLLVRAGSSGGTLDEVHAQVVNRALRFDELDAADVMVHRMDMKWIDISTPREQLLHELASVGHTRVPICRGDIDDVAGVLYLVDVAKFLEDPTVTLEDVMRPAEFVPENLVLSRLVNRMREARTHMVIVADEYGGTSGLVTLEDVVEEVFGELDDQDEADRPAIERQNDHRLSVRSDVRYDELLQFLNMEPQVGEETNTDTLAQIIVDRLGRMPRLGDSVECDVGTMRVENMARRRITRVRIQLKREDSSGSVS